MKLFFKSKDGGPKSSVTGYWLIESKSLFSIVLLKFEGKSRAAFHTHAFNAFSWMLKGKLIEYFHIDYKPFNVIEPSFIPFWTYKEDFHMVSSIGTSWALTFRGPWTKKWMEYTDEDGGYYLRSGRIKDGVI
jgi:hypothetical protein